MANIIFTILMTAAFGLMAWRFWQLQKNMRHQNVNTVELPQEEAPYMELQANVRELRHAMRGVVKTLNVMGHQVHHLNTLAGNAMEAVMEGEFTDSQQRPQIMIEFHGQDNVAQSRMITPEDLPPEMVERLQMFQTVYTSIINQQGLPSQTNPDQN